MIVLELLALWLLAGLLLGLVLGRVIRFGSGA